MGGHGSDGVVVEDDLGEWDVGLAGGDIDDGDVDAGDLGDVSALPEHADGTADFMVFEVLAVEEFEAGVDEAPRFVGTGEVADAFEDGAGVAHVGREEEEEWDEISHGERPLRWWRGRVVS